MIRRNISHFFPFPTPKPINFPFSFYRSFVSAKITHYSLLGISQSANQAEIKAAYLSKAKQYHPDIQKDPKTAKDAEEMFKKINEAYSVLSDDIKRKDYDETLNPTSRASSSGAGAYSERSGYQNDSSDFQYPHEKFYGKASAPDVEEDYHRKFHESNKRSRMEQEDSFFLRNLDMIIMSSLGLLLYLKWASVYNEDTNYMNGARIVKTENERLNPFEDDGDPEVLNVPVPKFDHQKLNFRECMQLNIEQLEALDRTGYILPKEFKERVMEYREIYHLSQPKNMTIWDYGQRKSTSQSQQETYSGPKFSPHDMMAPQGPQQSFIMSESPRQENRPAKPWPKGLPKPDANGNIGGTEQPKPQKKVQKPEEKQDINPKPVERKVVVADQAKVEEVEDAMQFRIPRMRANMYNMDRNK